jgi:membrane protein DedA with SNARE-associated domain/rhodanese-related sulfurtransferase
MIDLTALTQYGLPLLFLYILGQQAGLPLPAIPVLIAAGGMGSSVGFPIEVTLTAALAAMIADAGWYWIGTVAGRRVLRTLCRISISPDSCVRRTESTFTRWGAPSLLIARFVPAYSYVAPPLAGIAHTPVATFLMWDGLGALLWAGSAVFVGWLFRDAVGGILSTLAGLGRWGVLLLLAALVAYIAYRWWRRIRFMRQLRMERLSVAQLKKLIDDGDAPVILDVRSQAQRNSGVIPGAVGAYGSELDQVIPILLERSGEVVVYCSCPNEASAAVVARDLMRRGMKRVRPLHGGIDEWQLAGFPVATPTPTVATPARPDGAAASGHAHTAAH